MVPEYKNMHFKAEYGSQEIRDLTETIQISLTINCVGEPFMANIMLRFQHFIWWWSTCGSKRNRSMLPSKNWFKHFGKHESFTFLLIQGGNCLCEWVTAWEADSFTSIKHIFYIFFKLLADVCSFSLSFYSNILIYSTTLDILTKKLLV